MLMRPLCVRVSSLLVAAAGSAMAGAWTPLFDGKTLTGWEGNKAAFRVEDGAVVAGSMEKPVPRNEFLCTTREFADFALVLKVKLSGDPEKANAGIQIRSRRIPDHHEMIGCKADVGQHYWGSLYDESRRRKILAKADPEALRKALDRDGWNTCRIRCEGRRVRLWLNGRLTVDYLEPDRSIEQKGIIGLQIHSGPPCEVRYKEICVRDLSDGIPFKVAPVNPESKFEAAGLFDVNTTAGRTSSAADSGPRRPLGRSTSCGNSSRRTNTTTTSPTSRWTWTGTGTPTP